MIPALGQNFFYALRRLHRAPAFTVTVILTLALGIGATTVMFSLAEAAWLRPLPYPHARRLVNIWLHNPRYAHLDVGFRRAGATLVRRAPALGPSAEYVTGPAVWRLAGRRLQIGTALVSRRFFSLLGASVAAPSGQSAVVSRQLADRLGGPRRALGQTISTGGAAARGPHAVPRRRGAVGRSCPRGCFASPPSRAAPRSRPLPPRAVTQAQRWSESTAKLAAQAQLSYH